MGVYYFYVNHDKKQYFSIGLLGYGMKWRCLGQTPAARAFSLMLLEESYWKNNRVCVIGDEASEAEFDRIEQEYQNIEIDATLLLFEKDSIDKYSEHLQEGSDMFILLCEIVDILDIPDIRRYVSQAYGDSWRKKYAHATQQHPRRSYVDKLYNYKTRLNSRPR